MFGVPFWARAAHVMQLGAIDVAGKTDQPMPMVHDLGQASEKWLHDQHGDLSVQLAEHG